MCPIWCPKLCRPLHVVGLVNLFHFLFPLFWSSVCFFLLDLAPETALQKQTSEKGVCDWSAKSALLPKASTPLSSASHPLQNLRQTGHRLWHNTFFCGRSVFCQGARLLGWRRRKGYLPWRCPHGRRSSGQSTGWSVKRRSKWRRDTRRKTKRGSNEEQTLNRSSRMAWTWGDARMQTLEPCSEYAHHQTRAMCMRKMTREVYLSALSVGYSGSPSTANETNCDKKGHFKKLLWAPPTPVRRVPPWIAWGRVPSPILLWRIWFCKLFAGLLVKTVFERDCSSRIGSKSHRPIFAWLFKVRYHYPWYLSSSSVERWYVWCLLLQVRPSLCTSVLSIRLRVVIHDRLGLWENDREYL